MKLTFILFLLLSGLFTAAQSKEEQEISKLLLTQAAEWNQGHLEGFMQTYWKSDSLLFIGKNGVKHGWQVTLDNYKKSYPDAAAMGRLSFDIITVKKLSALYQYVVGKWMLVRTDGDISGHFDLLIKKIKGKWLIIADHSS